MATLNVSSSYLASALVQPAVKAQRDLTTAATEASTGEYADLGLQLGDKAGFELSLRNNVNTLTNLQTDNGLTGSRLTAAQNALDTIRTSANSTLKSLAAVQSASSGASLQSLGAGALQTLISTANTNVGGQYVFGGENTSQAPLSDYFASSSSAQTAIEQAFTTQFGVSPNDAAAANISAADIQTFLSGAFAGQFSGTNWSTNWSSASSTDITSQISPSSAIQTSVNANEAGFSQLSQAYAMLTAFAGTQLSQSAQQAVASTASTLISTGTTMMTNAEAALGSAQSQITSANDAISSQLTVLKTQIGSYDNVDPNQVAVQINTLMNQIQTSYEMTSRIHSMSLAQYLSS